MDNKTLKRVADNIRVLSAAMPEKAKSGHPGGPMGGTSILKRKRSTCASGSG